MTFGSRVCARICTRPDSARCSSSVQRTGRSPMTATTRSTMVACASGAAVSSATAKAAIRSWRSFTLPTLSTARSALAVLEALACARLAVLLAFLLARVAREEARSLHDAALLGVERDERPRDAVAHGLGLSALAAALAGGPHVELIRHLDELERLPQHH